jgi:hypothetical protein
MKILLETFIKISESRGLLLRNESPGSTRISQDQPESAKNRDKKITNPRW